MSKKKVDIKVLKEMFKAFDKDGNGFIDRDELDKTMNEDLEVSLTREQVDEMLNDADINKDGKIDYLGFFFIFF
jgi:Ca2+-binding EF-hand superfamily protein